MGVALLITFVTAFITANSQTMINIIYGNPSIPFVLFGAEVLMVFGISRSLNKLSRQQMLGMFLIYSVLNGLTFSAVFLIYSGYSIATVFLVAAAMFFCSAMAGVATKKELSMVGRIAIMGVVGLFVMNIASFFIPGIASNPLFNVIGIIIFCAMTAYDMQKVKKIHRSSFNGDPEMVNKLAIMAALSLYLDFINIFIYLLRLVGSRD